MEHQTRNRPRNQTNVETRTFDGASRLTDQGVTLAGRAFRVALIILCSCGVLLSLSGCVSLGGGSGTSGGRAAYEAALSAWEAEHAPNGYRDVDRKKNLHIRKSTNGYGKDGRMTRYVFDEGGTDDETQPRLFIHGVRVEGIATENGGGWEIYDGSRLTSVASLGLPERHFKARAGATWGLYDSFVGDPKQRGVHHILAGGDTYTKSRSNIYANGAAAWRSMAIKHGKKGPHDCGKEGCKAITQPGSTFDTEGDTFLGIDRFNPAQKGDRLK